MGITGAIGAATGVAGLGLQGAQHAQYTKQLAEQEELTKLQKKLGLYQLKQYEDAERQNAKKEMYTKPLSISSNLGSGMTTRSMAAAQSFNRNLNAYNTISNSGLGPLQRGMGSGSALMRRNVDISMQNLNNSHTPFTSTQSLNQNAQTSFTPLSQRVSTQSSLIGSTDTLGGRLNLGPRPNVGPVLNPRYASNNIGPSIEIQNMPSIPSQSIKPIVNPMTSFARSIKLAPTRMLSKFQRMKASVAPAPRDPVAHYNVNDDNVNIDLGQRRLGPSQTLRNLFGKLRARRQASVAPGSLDSLMHYMPDGTDDDNVNIPQGRPPRQASRISNFLRLARSHIPVRIRGGGGDGDGLLNDNVARRASLGTFMNRHKRRLFIAAGVVGGAALIGGAIAGGILESKKRRKEDMQGFDNGKAKGLFEQLSDGGNSGSGDYGGGGGGGGGGSGFKSGFRRFGQTYKRTRKYRKKSKGIKNTSKKLKRTKRGKKHGGHKRKVGVNFARFGQRKKSINKRGKRIFNRKNSVKKNRKRRKTTAF